MSKRTGVSKVGNWWTDSAGHVIIGMHGQQRFDFNEEEELEETKRDLESQGIRIQKL